jgi:hypothetical protein
MSNINFHKVSDIYWNPVKFSLASSDFNIKYTPLIFDNGIKFNLHECLYVCNDMTLNKKTGLFLTDLFKQNDFLEKNKNYGENQPLTRIVTPIADLDSKILTNQKIGSEVWNRLLPTDRINFTVDDNFIFDFKDDYVMIQFQKNKEHLTWLQGTGQGNLIFFPRVYPTIDRQKFSYLLGEETLILFQYDPYLKEIVLRDEMLIVNQVFGTMAYGLSSFPYVFKDADFPKSSVFKLLTYKKPITNNTDIKDSFLAKYQTTPLDKKTELEILPEYKKMDYAQNYLGIFPYEYPLIKENTAHYPLYFHGLKNYQTPEYNYSFYAKNAEAEDGKYGVRRRYDKIFSGTNQLNGLEQIFLGFHSNTLKIEFQTDTDTAFHFSPTAPRQRIQESNLLEDGALAGEIPYISDRLFLKLEDYSQKILDAPQPPSIKNGAKDVTNNTWLCSWLHLSSNGERIWLDRYYNSAYYTVNEALTSKVYSYEQKIEPDLYYVYDVPSEMWLEPGALYRFYHVGRKTRNEYLNYIDKVSNDEHLPEGGKIIHIKSWDSDPILDSSKYENNGILYFNKPENLKGDYIELDGSNHVLFPAKSILLEQTKLTVALWVNVDDWSNINGNQIFGNYYNSGFGLINDSALTTPLITLINKNTNKYHNINYRFGRISNFEISVKDDFVNNDIIKRLSDFSFWVFDTKYKTAKKISIDDQVLVDLAVDFVTEISQVEIDSNENIYIYDNKTKKYVVYNTYGVYINDENLPSNTNQIQIDLNDNIIPIYGTSSTIDSKNTVWQIIGGNLYKCTDPLDMSKSNIFANVGAVQDIICDAMDNLWVSHDQDFISKIDLQNEKVLMTFRIGKSAGLPVNKCQSNSTKKRYLGLIRVPIDANTFKCEIKNKTEDRLVIVDVDEKILYQLDSNGNLLIKLDLISLTSDEQCIIAASGDFTGYDYIRKYKISKKNLSWKLKLADVNNKRAQLFSLNYNISSITPGWHHFALSFDSTEGVVSSFMDGFEIEKINFTPKEYQLYYDYRTSLLLGIQNIKNTNLNDIIQINDGYKFIGKISDLRYYAKSLQKGVIEQIYLSSDYGAKDKSIVWNTAVGRRTYIEDIKNWYKMQLPGSKSKYYNINIYNLNVSDEIKMIIEDSIKNNLSKVAPAQANLYKINWK